MNQNTIRGIVKRLARLSVLVCLLAAGVAESFAAEPNAGFSPKPSVTVSRRGRLLHLDYKLLNAPKSYTQSVNRDRPAPKFTVYKDDRVIGSGTFSYG